MRDHPLYKLVLTLLIGVSITIEVQAIPINTNVALPVAKGHAVFRLQNKITKGKNGNQKAGHQVIMAGAFGISAKDVLIVALPTNFVRDPKGVGDLSLTLRHTVYRFDAPLLTSRLGLLGGVKLPTGENSVTTESTDWRLGAVFTHQHDRHEFDASVVYFINTEAQGAEKGDQIRHDLAYQLRLLPWELPDIGIPSQLNLVVELNGLYQGKGEIGGVTDSTQGGYRLFFSPGLQWVLPQFIVEGLIQIPVVQNLRSASTEDDFRVIAGIRFQF